jgi:hypothetical protein
MTAAVWMLLKISKVLFEFRLPFVQRHRNSGLLVSSQTTAHYAKRSHLCSFSGEVVILDAPRTNVKGYLDRSVVFDND